jgi:predicted esterase
MHGLGDTASGWTDAFPLRGLPNTRYILPTAPTSPVSLNMGYKMPSWFDLFGLDPQSPDDVAGIEVAVARVNQIIDGMYMAWPVNQPH